MNQMPRCALCSCPSVVVIPRSSITTTLLARVDTPAKVALCGDCLSMLKANGRIGKRREVA